MFDIIRIRYIRLGPEFSIITSPLTVAKCTELKPVPHSTLNTRKRKVGTIAKLACKRGYTGHGDSLVMCRKDLKWTPVKLKCVRKYVAIAFL
jgi:hypothetical protein